MIRKVLNMKSRKIKHIRKILCGFLCTVIAVSPTVSVSAAEYDEYGAPKIGRAHV